MIKPWVIRLQQWKQIAPKHHGYMLQITKLTLKREKNLLAKSFYFFKGEGGVESVKHLYLVEHKSSRELYHNDKHQSHTKIRQWNTWSYRAEQGAILNILLLSYFSLFWPGLNVLLNGYQGGIHRNPTTHHMGQLNGFITDYCSEKSLRCTSKFMMAQENEGKVLLYQLIRKA